MRLLNLLLSVAVFIGGTGMSLMLAAARYNGAPLRALDMSLISIAVACVVSAAAVHLILRRAPLWRKLSLYAALIALIAVLVLAHFIGLDGILPRRDGTQSVGLTALAVNAGSFGLVIVAATFACRRCFRFNSR